ncbi:MAG TPA: 6-phospho-beta-glucosidase [Candidatus Binatia bacterium]|nr:6-phospho-beta-glucosidase [Candidatus Binatia bacterium]
MKIAVVGGGSTYSPELVGGLGRLGHRVTVDELALQDIDPERLAVVGRAGERIALAHGYEGRVTLTCDLGRALDGADFVIFQIRVGGQAARHLDETLPLACGCVGQETTGAGGFAKALRTIPVILEIADEVRRRAAPGAWIIDFTNPVGIVTRALLDHGHRALGLCNVAIGFQRLFAGWLGVSPEEVDLGHAGLNHLTWIRRVGVAGTDRLPDLLRERGAELADHVELPRAVLDWLGAVPSYYLRYYYAHDRVVEELRHRPSRAQEVADLERQLLELYRDPALRDKPELLTQRGGAYYSEAALQLLASLVDGRGDVQVVDLRNRGVIAELPDDAVIEVPARIGRDGALPLPVPPLHPHMAGLAAHVAAYERLAAEAATSGRRDVALQALITHPLIGQIDLAERLLDSILAANRASLPAFA